MLQERTLSLTIYKIQAHTNIAGNEEANKLAKEDNKIILKDNLLLEPHEFAQSSPYWLCQNDDHPYKGPIKNFNNHLKKLEDKENKDIARTCKSINKWINDNNLDNKLSNTLWTYPTIIDAQITQLLKFHYSQYMGNAQKHIFKSEQYPYVNFSLYRLIEPNTWRHILLCCVKPHIHKLCINRHNKAIQHIRKFLISNTKSKYFTLMNVYKFNGKP